jgi:hypothetical protein
MVAPGLPEVVAVDVKQSGELVLDPEFSPGADGMICDSVRVRNLGDLPFESSSITLAASSWFSIPPDQIPFVIAPHSERALALCYQPLTAVDRLDTLRLGDACGVAIPLVLRTNLSVDDCGIPLAIHLIGKRTHVRTEPPYPNPAGDNVAIQIERASPTLEPPPAGACGLYSNLGVEVATASYMPERGWSLDGMSYERGSFTFATDQLPAGIYHVRIRLGEAVTSYPVVIAR